MSAAVMTSDEIVAAIKKSSLPTVLVEGSDDMIVYRWIEDRLGAQNANILPCGGRIPLLTLFNRRQEFSARRTVFLVDRDMWLFQGVPSGYSGLLMTTGYSIENDLLAESSVHSLLTIEEKAEFEKLADLISEWFAFEVEECCSGFEYCVDIHLNQLIPLGKHELATSALLPRVYRRPEEKFLQSVRTAFSLKVRGKTVLHLYGRLLNAPSRTAKYSRKAILEVATKCLPTQYVRQLLQGIQTGLIQGTPRVTP